MDAAVYRKVKKLISKPRQYIEDARLNRQLTNADQARSILTEAQALFAEGYVAEARAKTEAQPAQFYLSTLLLIKIAMFEKQYALAEQHAFHVMQQLSPYSGEFKRAFFLHQEALRWQHQHDAALTMLANMPFKDHSSRFYRALRLACAGANCPATFESHLIGLTSNHNAWLRARHHYLMLLRDLGRSERALKEADVFIHDVLAQPLRMAKPMAPRTSAAKQAWQTKAANALAQLKQALANYDIEFFLVSGTLLGCVREGAILGHDTDIDVGILPQTSMKQLREALSATPFFKFQEVFSENTLYLEHTSGVHIDVFRHYEQDGKLYHGGIKCHWWNTPFTLVPATFLGEHYLIPEDTDTYLTENYGDWRSPIIDFATFLDTPNMEVNNPVNMALYYAAQCVSAYRQGETEKSNRYRRAFDALVTNIIKDIRHSREG